MPSWIKKIFSIQNPVWIVLVILVLLGVLWLVLYSFTPIFGVARDGMKIFPTSLAGDLAIGEQPWSHQEAVLMQDLGDEAEMGEFSCENSACVENWVQEELRPTENGAGAGDAGATEATGGAGGVGEAPAGGDNNQSTEDILTPVEGDGTGEGENGSTGGEATGGESTGASGDTGSGGASGSEGAGSGGEESAPAEGAGDSAPAESAPEAAPAEAPAPAPAESAPTSRAFSTAELAGNFKMQIEGDASTEGVAGEAGAPAETPAGEPAAEAPSEEAAPAESAPDSGAEAPAGGEADAADTAGTDSRLRGNDNGESGNDKKGADDNEGGNGTEEAGNDKTKEILHSVQDDSAAPAPEAPAETPPAGPVVSGIRKVLTLSGFSLEGYSELIDDSVTVKSYTLRISMAASGQAGDKLTLQYFSAGEWHELDEYDLAQPISNESNGGYWLYVLPFVGDKVDLSDLQVRLIYEGAAESKVYVDAAWIELDFGGGEEDESLEEMLAGQEFQIQDIEEGEFLGQYRDLKKAFKPATITLAADKALVAEGDLKPEATLAKTRRGLLNFIGIPVAERAEKPKFKLQDLQKTKDSRQQGDNLENKLEMEKVTIKTEYVPAGNLNQDSSADNGGETTGKVVSLAEGGEVKNLKQNIVVENKSDQTINYTLTLEQEITSPLVFWSGQAYEISKRPLVFKGYNKQANVGELRAAKPNKSKDEINSSEFDSYFNDYTLGTRVEFYAGGDGTDSRLRGNDNGGRAAYDWSDIPAELKPEVKAVQSGDRNLLILTLKITVEAGQTYTIDPNYGLIDPASYNVRYDGAVAGDGLTMFGTMVIGDVNGDGNNDLVLGSYLADNTYANSGSVWVIFGGSELAQGNKSLSVSGNYNIRYNGGAANNYLTYGGAIAIGDVNSDGLADLVLGAYNAGNNGASSGSAYVIFSTLIDDVGATTGNNKSLATAANYNIRYNGDAASIYLTNHGALAIGDVNGDGLGDLVLGAYQADNTYSNSGSAWVMFSTLIDDVTSSTGNNKPLSTATNYNIRYDGGVSGDYLTYTGALAIGDVNGDGLGDLVLGSYPADNTYSDSGSAWVMFSALIDDVGATTGNNKPLSTATNYNIRYDGGAAANYLTRNSVPVIGDINGDGLGDLVLGAYAASNNGASSGSAWVMFSTLIDDVTSSTGNNKPLSTATNYNIRYDGGAAGIYFIRYNTTAIGDINGDGLGDLVLGAYGADNNGADSGSAWVMFSTLIDDVGATTGNNKPLSTATNYNIRYDGGAANDYLPYDSALTIGDVNSDGLADLVLGAYNAGNNGASSGSVWVMFSTLIDDATSSTGNNKPLSTATNYNIRYDGGAANDQLTAIGAIGNLSALFIGDVNGDGLGDLVLGAYNASNNGAISGSAWVMFGPPGSTSSSIAVYESSTTDVTPIDPGIEGSPAVLSRVLSDDGLYWATDGAGYDSQAFKFAPDLTEISNPKATITWVGYGDTDSGKKVYLKIWNFNTSAWELLDDESCSADCTLSGNKTGMDYKDGDGYFWVWVKADNNLNTDQIYITVEDFSNTAPSFSAGPSDGGSSATTPTNSGSNVVFTATAADSESDAYYLAVCKTNEVIPHNSAAPTCATDSTWCVSSGTSAAGSANTCSYTTGDSDAETKDWYAFVCDYNADGKCSAMSQASGDNGSPFAVNRAPTFTAYSDDSPKVPGESVIFSTSSTDSDTGDTVKLYVCSSASFTDGGTPACDVTTLCSTTTGVATHPSCTYAVPTPKQDTTYNAYGYIVDGHGFASAGTSQGTDSTLTIGNATPTISAATVQLLDTDGLAGDLTLTEENGETTGFKVKFTATDSNSCLNSAAGNELDQVSFAAYRSGVTSSTCSTPQSNNLNNCYFGPGGPSACVQDVGSCSGATDTDATFTCTFGLQYLADPTVDGSQYPDDKWLTNVEIRDDNSSSSGQIEALTGTEMGLFMAYDVFLPEVGAATDTGLISPESYDSSMYVDNPNNAVSNDNNYAYFQAYVAPNNYPEAAYRNFLFSYGDAVSATISGIEVQLDGKSHGDAEDPNLYVSLSWDGGMTWTDEKNVVVSETSEVTDTLGGAADTWGRTWTMTEASMQPFRVKIEQHVASASYDLDHLQVKVYYTPNLESDPAMAYGTLIPGGDSDEVGLTVKSLGNVGLDLNLSGANMCTDYPTCSGSSIAIGAQVWNLLASQGWVAGTALTTSPDEAELNCEKTIDQLSPKTANIYFILRAPNPTAAGEYTGIDTIAGVTAEVEDWGGE